MQLFVNENTTFYIYTILNIFFFSKVTT